MVRLTVLEDRHDHEQVICLAEELALAHTVHVHEVLGVHLGVNSAVVGPELGSAPGVLDTIGVEELGVDLAIEF